MKRTLLALLSVLTLGFAGLIAAPSQAQAAVSCTPKSVTASPALTHTLLYDCTIPGTEAPLISRAVVAVSQLKTNSRISLDDGNHFFYIFKTRADYDSYAGTSPNPATNPPLPLTITIPTDAQGHTWSVTGTPRKWYTVVFLDQLVVGATKNIENLIHHEAGHHFDAHYSTQVGGGASASEAISKFGKMLTGARLTVGGGTPYVIGHKIKLTLSLLDPQTITYSVHPFEKVISAGGETPATVAAWFVNQINITLGNTTQKVYAEIATLDPTTFFIRSEGKYIIKYEKAYVGTTFSFYKFADHDFSQFISTTETKCGSNGIWSGTRESLAAVPPPVPPAAPGEPIFICTGSDGTGATLSAPYLGLDNAQIALKAWKYFYAPELQTGTTTWKYAELWAEITARISNQQHGKPDTPDGPLTNNFLCSRALVFGVLDSGSVPGSFTGQCLVNWN